MPTSQPLNDVTLFGKTSEKLIIKRKNEYLISCKPNVCTINIKN